MKRNHSKCSRCGRVRPVCCDNGYRERSDGYREHDNGVCRMCCSEKHRARREALRYEIIECDLDGPEQAADVE